MKEQLKQLKKYKIEVIKSIHDTVNILEKNYGIRDVEQDLGGYVVIAENIVDIEVLKQGKIPEYTNIIKILNRENLYQGAKER